VDSTLISSLSVDTFQMEEKLGFKAEILNNGVQNTNGFNEDELIVKLYNVGSFKFGTFKMRNGEESPVYVDLRVLWSYPELVVSFDLCRPTIQSIMIHELKARSCPTQISSFVSTIFGLVRI